MKKLLFLIAVFSFIATAAAAPSKWRYTDSSEGVVVRLHSDGRIESKSVAAKEIQEWKAKGNVPDAYVPPVKTKAQKVAADIDMPTTLERLEALEGTQADRDAMKARIDAVNAKY